MTQGSNKSAEQASVRDTSERAGRNGVPWLTTVVLLVAVFIGINMLASLVFGRVRLDLTKGQLYTLSRPTRDILGSIEEPITLRLYVTQDAVRDFPSLRTQIDRVESLLREYDSVGGENVRYELVNTEPDTDAADQARAAGLRAPPTLPDFYFGLIGTNSLDGRETVPAFLSVEERFLEYEISRVVERLANPQRPVFGVISSLPVLGEQPNQMMMMQGQRGQPAWRIFEELRQDADVREVDPEAGPIEDDIDVLLVIHPKTGPAAGPGAAPPLSEDALRQIDAYALSGRPLLVFVDPSSVLDPAGQGNPMMGMPGGPTSSDLGPLFDAWGLSFTADQVVADREYGVTTVSRTTGAQERDPVRLMLEGDALDAEDPMLQGLERLQMPGVGVFRHDASSGTGFTPLLRSSDDAMLADPMVARVGASGPVLNDFAPAGEPFVLAARVTGTARSAFADEDPADADADADADQIGPQPEGPEQPGDDGPAGSTSGEINVVVFGDVDFLYDVFWMQRDPLFGLVQTADNPTLLISALENLRGTGGLSRLRARGTLQRPLTLIDELQAEAQQANLEVRQRLDDQITETQQRINELQTAREERGTFVLSAEQEAELERLEDVLVDARREQRDLRRQLREDVEGVERMVKVLNTVAMPVLVACAAVGLAGFRAARRAADRRSMAGQG